MHMTYHWKDLVEFYIIELRNIQFNQLFGMLHIENHLNFALNNINLGLARSADTSNRWFVQHLGYPTPRFEFATYEMYLSSL